MAAFRRKLLAWYDTEKRDLPWRRTRNAYWIWVSEIMCQQTRVSTVIPYFERFIAAFPTVEDLANASEDEVMGMWSGLGYYRRAKLLHHGAKQVATDYGGKVPGSLKDRASLPGVGPYTAGAIGSIAFDKQEPIVDGNVMRVFSRYFARHEELGTRQAQKVFWEIATEYVKGPRPGDANQALMELGALVCLPKDAARCKICCVRSRCQARRENIVSILPRKKEKKKPIKMTLYALVATSGKKVLLEKRTQGLFAGLWSPPLREDPFLNAKTLGSFNHLLSHRDFQVIVQKGSPEGQPGEFFSPEQIESVGISSMTRKILDTAKDEKRD